MPEIKRYGHKFYRFWEHEIIHYQKYGSFESIYRVIKHKQKHHKNFSLIFT